MTDRPETYVTVDMEEARRLAQWLTHGWEGWHDPPEMYLVDDDDVGAAYAGHKLARALLAALDENEALQEELEEAGKYLQEWLDYGHIAGGGFDGTLKERSRFIIARAVLREHGGEG